MLSCFPSETIGFKSVMTLNLILRRTHFIWLCSCCTCSHFLDQFLPLSHRNGSSSRLRTADEAFSSIGTHSSPSNK